MGSYGMRSARLHTKGFTLIASLLMLLLLSGIAIGLLMMVNTEGKVGGTDLKNDAALRSAEGGMEKMTSDLATVFKNAQAPQASDICGVGGPAFGGSAANEPTIAGITWLEYQVTPAPGLLGQPCPTQAQFTAIANNNWGNVQSGPNQGLYAQIIPISMLATADFPGGQEVSMVRTAQVALIPVFQFGVFSESDVAFFPGEPMNFVGPVHTNGDLYLSGKANVTFQSQLSAYGNVVRTVLPNGNNTYSSGYTSSIYIPTANTPNPCSPVSNPLTGSNGPCTTMDASNAGTYGDASVTGMGSSAAQPLSTYNGQNAWYTFSKNKTNHEIINGNYGSTVTNDTGTGAVQLSMPFVNGTTFPYEIIRRPPANEVATSALGQSREYNLAQIHVLLADDPAELPGGAADVDNVRLANLAQASGDPTVSAWGVTIPAANYNTATWGTSAGNNYNLYFATASNAVPVPSNCSTAAGNPPICTTPEWPYAPAAFAGQSLTQGLQPAGAPSLWSYGTPTIDICQPSIYPPAALPAGCPTAGSVYPYYALPISDTPVAGATLTNYPQQASSNAWNLIDGYLRVEYKVAGGAWVGATREWLGLGFARGINPPTQSGGGTPTAAQVSGYVPTPNPINPNAILLLQEPADRGTPFAAEPAATGATAPSVAVAPTCSTHTGSGAGERCTTWTAGSPAVPLLASDAGSGGQWAFGVTPPAPTTTTPQSLTQFNWYPINFYDVREGENRDNSQSNDSCTTNGVMNAVEIDVGNLKRWLFGQIGINPTTGLSSGQNVDYKAQNGWVLYFSDRRGMLTNPNGASASPAGTKSGDSGLEDVINASSAAGTPDGVLQSPGGTASPEDDNQNGVLDNYGVANLGLGFWNSAAQNLNTAINTPTHPDPFGTASGSARITTCSITARKNWVSGARHVLRLVDGALSNVPERWDAGATANSPGGFTVASENPVYILGDYNSTTNDSAGWVNDTAVFQGDAAGHSAASVIADTVTFLSNSWQDINSMQTNVTALGNRNATITTSYRLAISSGKNRVFPFSSTSTWSVQAADQGTDGGVHNFLHFLENWQTGVYYKGSLVSLYFSTYNTGFYKCCNIVYSPPSRNYFFDLDFTSPGGLPPGTPLFRDVESLGYRQLFTTRTSSN